MKSTSHSKFPFLRAVRPPARPIWALPLLVACAPGLIGCGNKKSAPSEDVKARDLSPLGDSGKPHAEAEAEAETPHEQPDHDGSETAEAPPRPEFPEHKGPWLWVLRSSAAVYKEPKGDRDAKIGYIKRGGKVGISDSTVEGDDCPEGWYRVASGGYICSHVGTTDENHKDVKFRPAQPNVDEILPYKYARNSKNGTPLYRSIPSKKQSYQYEPYLPGAIAERERLEEERLADERQMRKAGLAVGDDPPPDAPAVEGDEPPREPPDEAPEAEKKARPDPKSPSEKQAKKKDSDPPVEPEPPPAEDEDIPLWEREEGLHEVTLEDLRKDKDDILEMRMMKGFYIAIDKTFQWDGRTWYKTTKGLVTPSASFWQTEGSDFQGAEIDGKKIQLPLGWVIGVKESAPTYEIDEGSNERKPKGSKKRFELVELEYSYHRIGDIEYFRMKNGDWIRDAHIRMTTPHPRPPEIGPHERWVDIDISEQTLVVFEGDRPVYATLISSGKESRVKEKDHSTPRGMWRVREKHVVATMDGDGTAAGDLPYSIQDVPYIMYFHKSYATHGAFWHRNYGVQMSHGCVNLAPLDAKWLFFYADPQLPPGFHGNWSSDDNKGTMIVVHD